MLRQALAYEACDCSTQPLQILAKLNALQLEQRHSWNAKSRPVAHSLHFDRFEIRPDQRQVLVDGKPALLGARAFDLLMVLVQHREQVLTKDELLTLAWPGLVVEENNLTVQISALRRLFGASSILTLTGRGYRFVMPAEIAAVVSEPASTPVPVASEATVLQMNSTEPLTLPDKPSIAVLPFDNFSQNAEMGYFTDGLTEDITTELSRFRSLFVIARNSAYSFKNRSVDVRTVARDLGVRYVLEGSVRHAANRIRVSAQLIEAVSGHHLWAEKFDRTLADIFDVQEEVTRAIVAAIAPQIDQAEGNWARKARPENLAAYGLSLRAWAIANGDTVEPQSAGREQAEALARQALKIDPDSPLAWRTIALIQWARVYFNVARNRSEVLAEGLMAANRALSLDSTDHIAMTWKGVLLGLDGDEAGCLAALRSARDINRNYVLCLGFLGMYEAWSGNRSVSIAHALEAFRLSPLDPNRQILLVLLGFTYFANHQDAEALATAQTALREAPQIPAPHMIAAMTHVALGQMVPAKAAFKEAQRLAPKMIEARLAGEWLTTNAAYVKRAMSLLKIAAGLEDESAGFKPFMNS